MNQLVATALGEKLSALETVEYLEARGAKASRERYLEALGKVPDAPPVPGDELPKSGET